jgi:hypothetical protein
MIVLKLLAADSAGMLSNQPIKTNHLRRGMTIKVTQQILDHILRKGGRPPLGCPIAHDPLRSADSRDHHHSHDVTASVVMMRENDPPFVGIINLT